MNQEQQTACPDRLIQSIASEGMLRVTLIEATALVREAHRVHGLSRVATAALGRQLMMTAMMAADLKHEDDKISTILKGNGPAGSMICTGNAALEVKGSVTNGASELPPTPECKLDVGGFVGCEGKLTVVSDMGLKEPYVGVSNLVSGEIAVDFAQYYAVSLQRPALIYLGVRVNAESGEVLAAGGVFAEPMPGCPDELIDRLQQKSEEISALSKKLVEGETADAFLQRVFRDLDMEIVSEREPRYVCDCSRKRIEQALIATGAEELRDMMENDHGATVTCRFCDRSYAFTEEDLRELIKTASGNEDEDS
ncbi:MAG TPA: Hsp33 family molecular chaperone HslO [Feifaniaceae bacterium]|nr:Hsp33 family molecular chaperone HslO [Feifaniaceae bacterium]